MTSDTDFLARIAAALERLAPSPAQTPDFAAADAFVWHAEPEGFEPVAVVNRVPLSLLKGIDRAADQLLANTERFARGLPANNALLWGARGMGKSSLVKAAHAEVSAKVKSLKLVEIHREDISSLPRCLGHLMNSPARFIVFCDDLSFDHDDTSYKSLKAVLEGHDRQRARQRHQPGRGGRGKGFPVGPFRPVARLPQLQPGRLSGDDLGLRETFRAEGEQGPARA
jgi:predicted AAA+ superfamily ATPase